MSRPGSDTVTAARNEGMEVHEFGAVTAVVTGWLIVEGHSKGAAFTHSYRFTDTWVKRKPDGRSSPLRTISCRSRLTEPSSTTVQHRLARCSVDSSP